MTASFYDQLFLHIKPSRYSQVPFPWQQDTQLRRLPTTKLIQSPYRSLHRRTHTTSSTVSLISSMQPMVASQTKFPLPSPFPNCYIQQQMYVIHYKSYTRLTQLLRVSAPKRHPQGIADTQEYKHQTITLDITMPNNRTLKT
jgi:hypothetical protein